MDEGLLPQGMQVIHGPNPSALAWLVEEGLSWHQPIFSEGCIVLRIRGMIGTVSIKRTLEMKAGTPQDGYLVTVLLRIPQRGGRGPLVVEGRIQIEPHEAEVVFGGDEAFWQSALSSREIARQWRGAFARSNSSVVLIYSAEHKRVALFFPASSLSLFFSTGELRDPFKLLKNNLPPV